jgi:hypothetical protein
MTSRPFVTTFYSYKGGVGRTTLAANVAVALASRGKTLLWDLDIEAPGLEHIPALKTHKPVKRGWFGALVEWQKAKCPAKLTKSLLKPWDAALGAVQKQPRLFLLPAAPDAKVQLRDSIEIDWAAHFERELGKGPALLDALLAHWGGEGFEFVVIDAPDGVSDLGALLTALVPDVTVLVGNFGVQNTHGLRLAWQALGPVTGDMPKREERGLSPLERELVASPIPPLDEPRRTAANALWKKHLGLEPTEWMEIPEHAALRFSEGIALLEYPADDPLVRQYEKVAQRVLAVHERRQEALREDASASPLYPELMKPRGRLLHPGERGREAQKRGRRFEEQVAHMLRLLRHTVERETLVDANRIDFIATTSGTLGDVTWFVECKETSVTKDMADKLAMWVQDPQARARNARAMTASSSPVAATTAACGCGTRPVGGSCAGSIFPATRFRAWCFPATPFRLAPAASLPNIPAGRCIQQTKNRSTQFGIGKPASPPPATPSLSALTAPTAAKAKPWSGWNMPNMAWNPTARRIRFPRCTAPRMRRGCGAGR